MRHRMKPTGSWREFHPFIHGSRPRLWSGTVNYTHYIMSLYLIFILSLMYQDIGHDQVESTVHTKSCYCTWFSSLHSWIKTQTMIRYSQLYTVHHVTVLDFHPFTPGSRPRPWSGTDNCPHYIFYCTWFSSLNSWIKTQTMIRYRQLSTLHFLLYLIFILELLDQDPDHDQVQSTVQTTMLLYLNSSLHFWIKTQTIIRYSQLYTLHHCAADFSLLNLPKGKSLGRSKPATNS